MRKIVFLSSLFLILLLAISTPVSAALTKQVKIPTIIKGTTESIQKVIDTLISKTDNHEVRIVELEKKVATLEEKIKKLETKSVIDDANNNTQQPQILKESSETIPLNQLQQDSSGLIQKIGEFISNSSSQLSPAEIIGPGVIDLNSSIKP